MDTMKVILLPPLHDPFPCNDVGAGFGLPAAFEREMMAPEQVLKSVEGLIFKCTDDLIITDLVNSVDPSFQHLEKEDDHHHQQTGNG